MVEPKFPAARKQRTNDAFRITLFGDGSRHASRGLELLRRRTDRRLLGGKRRGDSHNRIDRENIYVIKGVAGRLLAYMLDLYVSEGRSEFTNREIRAAASLRLPEIKDNLETRLLLLRRRMDERNLPIRLLHAGRGQVRLLVNGTPDLQCNIK